MKSTAGPDGSIRDYGYATPAQRQAAQINAAVQQMIAAQSAPIVNAQNRYNAGAQQQQTNIQGLTEALAGILGGIAPGVQKTYSDAATNQAGFAKGFSDEMQARLGQNADSTSSFLQTIGAPQSQVDQVRGQVAPAGARDTLYGLQGFIPASTLNREGAAFTAAAKQLPGIASTQGLQQIAKVQSAQRDEQSKTSDKLAELAGTIPKLRSDLTNQAFDQAYKTHSANLADAKFAFDKNYKVGQANFQVDKFNAQQSLGYQKMAQQAYQSDRTYRVSLANLGIAQRKEQIAALAAEAKLKGGGFTPVQVTKFTGTANAIAEDAFKGIPKFDKSGNVVTKNGQPVWDAPPLDYKAALREMKKSHSGVGSVPLSIATAALNQWYTNPGKRGRPLTQTGDLSFDFSAVNQLANAWSGPLGKVTVAPGADRPGVSLNPVVQSFVGRIASVYKKPLTIGTGTNHNEFVAGSDRESDHWTGNAADIPASGAALTRLGQAALVAAGADPRWARQQKGGLFNFDTPNGRVQVIFNSMEGGNHFNHLHVGIR